MDGRWYLEKRWLVKFHRGNFIWQVPLIVHAFTSDTSDTVVVLIALSTHLFARRTTCDNTNIEASCNPHRFTHSAPADRFCNGADSGVSCASRIIVAGSASDITKLIIGCVLGSGVTARKIWGIASSMTGSNS